MLRLFSALIVLGLALSGAVLAEPPASQTEWRRISQTSHEGPIRAIAVSKDGRVIATGGHEARIYIWDAKDLVLLRVLEGHQSWVADLAFLQGSGDLVSRSFDGTVRIWDTESGTELMRYGGGDGDRFGGFLISPDETRLLLEDFLSTGMRLIDLADGREIASNISLRFDLEPVVTAWSADGSSILVAAGRHLYQIEASTLSITTQREIVEERLSSEVLASASLRMPEVAGMLTLQDTVRQVAVLLLEDGHLEKRDANSLDVIWSLNLSDHFEFGEFGFPGTVHAFEKQSLLGVFDKLARTWVYVDLESGSVVPSPFARSFPSSLIAEVSSDTYAIAENDGGPFSAAWLVLFDPARGIIGGGATESALQVEAVAGARDSARFAAGTGHDGQVRVFDLPEGQAPDLVAELRVGGVGASALSMSADGTMLAQTGMGAPGVVWSLADGRIVEVAASTTYMQHSIQLTPDASWLVMPQQANTPLAVMMRDLTGQGRMASVRSTADLGFAMPVVAADGSKIAVGTNDLGVLIFDPHRPLDQSGEPVATVPLDPLAWTLAAASKATVFAAGSQGGEVCVIRGNAPTYSDLMRPPVPISSAH